MTLIISHNWHWHCQSGHVRLMGISVPIDCKLASLRHQITYEGAAEWRGTSLGGHEATLTYWLTWEHLCTLSLKKDGSIILTNRNFLSFSCTWFPWLSLFPRVKKSSLIMKLGNMDPSCSFGLLTLWKLPPYLSNYNFGLISLALQPCSLACLYLYRCAC